MNLLKQKRKYLSGIMLLVGASVLAFSARAEEPTDAVHEKWPQATLNAQASTVVPQDRVRITLAAEYNESSQAKVAERLSKALDSAVKQAKENAKVKDSTIKVSSGNYSVWPTNDKEGKISTWHGRAEVILESADFAAASELASALGDRVAIVNLNFSVSPQTRAKQEEALLADAAQAFRDRAQALAVAFGFAGYTIRNVQLGGAGAQYQPAPRMMAMASEKVAAPLEAGSETITVSVRGSIFLRSSQK